MPHSYVPNPSNNVATYTLPNNGDPATAESVNPDGFEDLADKLARMVDGFGRTAPYTLADANLSFVSSAHGIIFACPVIFSMLGVGFEPMFSTGFRVTSGVSLQPAQWVGSRLLGDAQSEFNWAGLVSIHDGPVGFDNSAINIDGSSSITTEGTVNCIFAGPCVFNVTTFGQLATFNGSPASAEFNGSVQCDAGITVTGASVFNTITTFHAQVLVDGFVAYTGTGHDVKRVVVPADGAANVGINDGDIFSTSAQTQDRTWRINSTGAVSGCTLWVVNPTIRTITLLQDTEFFGTLPPQQGLLLYHVGGANGWAKAGMFPIPA